jgi:hypothetical protein
MFNLLSSILNVYFLSIFFECVQTRARIWLTNFLHDTNTVHWEDKEHSTTVPAEQYNIFFHLFAIVYKPALRGWGTMVNLSLIQQAGPESWPVSQWPGYIFWPFSCTGCHCVKAKRWPFYKSSLWLSFLSIVHIQIHTHLKYEWYG